MNGRREKGGFMPLVRQLQVAIALTSIVPLLSLSYLILRYVGPSVLAKEGIAALLIAIMVLMLTGTRMIFRLISRVGVVSAPARESRRRAVRRRAGERTIRHTVAEATALIGVIPVLALGYVVVRYVMPTGTTESIFLLTLIIVGVLLLGMHQIRHLTRHILTVAADAKVVRMETGRPAVDTVPDEIGELSTDLEGIAEKLSARAGELRRTREFIEHLPHPLLVVDAEGTIELANPAATGLLGYGADELSGMNIASLSPSGDDAEWILPEGEGGWRELVWSRKDGGRVPVSVRSGLLSQEGRKHGLVVVATDLSERRKLERELLHAQKMEAIGLLAGGIAHDFNNILAGIIGFTSLMKDKHGENAALMADLDRIERLAWRGGDLTQALLAFARKGEYNPEPIDIKQLVDNVVKVVGRTAGKHVSIKEECSLDVMNVHGDRGQIHQMLMNLCINACEAMPDGGTLTVGLANTVPDEKFRGRHRSLREGAHVAIVVRDTGVGIEEAVRGRIFEPFFTTKPPGQGTGLGLAMVIGIVEGHGGCVQVESSVGAGSVFTVFLPASFERARPPEGASPEVLEGARSVLVVDDEVDFRDSVAMWLLSRDCTVYEAADGEEALRMVREHGEELDLVILDMIMEGMGGDEAFRKIRGVAPRLPILICTGYSLDGACRGLLREKSTAFIQKPFGHSALAAKIQDVLGRA